MRAPGRTGVYHGWWVVLVAVLAMFAATLTGGSGFSVFILPITAELGWDRKTIAGALSVGTILGALAAPFCGRLVDRYGARVMLTVTGLALAATLLPIAWVQTPLMFYLCYGGARLVDMGLLNTAATTAVANWFVRLRGRALGLTVAGNAVGVALVTPLAQWIIEGWGWRVAWFILALTAVLVLTPLAWLLVRRRPEDLGLLPDGDPLSGATPLVAARVQAMPAPLDWPLAAAMRTAAYWLLMISSALTMFSVAGISLHQVPILVSHGLDPSAVAWLVSVYGLGWAAGCLGWGVIGERLPARYALALVYGLGGLCVLALLQIHGVPLAVAYALLFGLMNGGKESLDALVWADYYGRRSLGAIRGFSRPLVVGANAAGGFAAGWSYDVVGSYEPIIVTFGIVALAGSLLVLLARPPIPRGAWPARDALPGRIVSP